MLNRSGVRWCISLAVIGSIFLSFRMSWPRQAIGRWGLVLGGLFVAAAVFIKYTVLKCPQCGAHSHYPQWYKNDNQYCIKCGTLIHWE